MEKSPFWMEISPFTCFSEVFCFFKKHLYRDFSPFKCFFLRGDLSIQTDYFSLFRILRSNFDLFSSIPNRYVLFHSEWRFIQSNFWNSKHIHSGNSSININCVAVFINIFFWRNLQSEPEWRNIYSGLKNHIYIYTVEIREKHFYFFFAYLFVTQFVHVKVHFKGFVYWMYEIILVYILDTWSSYVLARLYIYIYAYVVGSFWYDH